MTTGQHRDKAFFDDLSLAINHLFDGLCGVRHLGCHALNIGNGNVRGCARVRRVLCYRCTHAWDAPNTRWFGRPDYVASRPQYGT